MFYIIDNRVEKTDDPELIAKATDTIPDEVAELYLYNSVFNYKIENGKFIKLKPEEEIKADLIRSRRSAECFPIINRGALWYDKLTEEQKTELSAWYEAWLDAPETGTAPTAPVWLNEVAGQEKAI